MRSPLSYRGAGGRDERLCLRGRHSQQAEEHHRQRGRRPADPWMPHEAPCLSSFPRRFTIDGLARAAMIYAARDGARYFSNRESRRSLSTRPSVWQAGQ
jgi:hypothetical protein